MVGEKTAGSGPESLLGLGELENTPRTLSTNRPGHERGESLQQRCVDVARVDLVDADTLAA